MIGANVQYLLFIIFLGHKSQREDLDSILIMLEVKGNIFFTLFNIVFFLQKNLNLYSRHTANYCSCSVQVNITCEVGLYINGPKYNDLFSFIYKQKILLYLPDLIHRRWQFHSIGKLF